MSTRAQRISIGMVLAVVAGIAGPIQQAVSQESGTYVELEGPIPYGPDTQIGFLYLNSRRGAAANWRVDDGLYVTDRILFASIGDSASGPVRGDSYDLEAHNDRRAMLRVITCPKDDWYSCTYQTWEGTGVLEMSVLLNEAEFEGTLSASGGGTCEVEAVWTARENHAARYTQGIRTVHGRTRAPAFADIDTSCTGNHILHGMNEAEIWTDTNGGL